MSNMFDISVALKVKPETPNQHCKEIKPTTESAPVEHPHLEEIQLLEFWQIPSN